MSYRFHAVALAALFGGALFLVPPMTTPAFAQLTDRCAEDQSEDQGGRKNYRTIIDANGRKIFVIEKEVVVCGKVPKPNVIYVLQASTINYEWESLKQDFIPRVLESVKKAPF